MHSHHVRTLHVRNYRSLADVTLSLGAVNVFFGPNGTGKSSLLDALWFLRDCAVRGVDQASSDRNHGLGMRWYGASEAARIEFEITTEVARYVLSLGTSDGRIEPRAAEVLTSVDGEVRYFSRAAGSDTVLTTLPLGDKYLTLAPSLRQSAKLGIETFLTFHPEVAAAQSLDASFRAVRRFVGRDLDLLALKRRGSETSHEQSLSEGGENAWSVLRNIQAKARVDARWRTILGYMREAFPSFDDIDFEQVGPSAVYASFVERGLPRPVPASGVSDGHLVLLLLLTALFAEPEDRGSIVIFDEPDLSLHPWALAVFAKAVKEGAERWGKQIIIATHSPVLLSQFDPSECLALARSANGTQVTRVSEMDGIGPLLEGYALGSLYMAEAIAPQHTTEEPA